MADFITQFPSNEIVARSNFNARIAEANAGLIAVQNAAAAAQNTADQKANFQHTHTVADLTGANPLGIDKGGTNAKTAAVARANLEVPSTTEVNAALSNKAGINHTHLAIDVGALGVTGGQIRAAENTNCDDYAVGTTYGTNSLAETQTLINGPPNAQTAVTIYTLPGNRNGSDNYAIQIATCRVGNVVWIRSCDGINGYGAWVVLATAKSPTEYNLPLASGVSHYDGSSKYAKSQDSVVTINSSMAAATIADGQQIASMPVGYRPKITIYLPLSSQITTTRYTGLAKILPTGAIIYHGVPATSEIRLFFAGSFIAAP